MSVEPFWPGLFAGALKDVNVTDLITTIGSGVGSGPATGGAAAAAAPVEEAAEAKKESSEEESGDDDMGFGLFD